MIYGKTACLKTRMVSYVFMPAVRWQLTNKTLPHIHSPLLPEILFTSPLI